MTISEIEKEETMVLAARIGDSFIRVGACVHYPGRGWKFIPSVTHHKPSRRYWPSCNACIPRWAFDKSDEMFTASEYLEVSA